MPKFEGVVVIGGGITGMGAAWRLHSLGVPVVVLEAGARVGGVVESRRTEGGVPLELGPQTLSTRDPDLLADLDALGLRAQMHEADPAGGRRYIVHEGRPALLPVGPLGFLSTPLLSWGAKIRALAEPVRGRNGGAKRVMPGTPDLRPGVRPDLMPNVVLDPMDESVASFVTRRFGPEVLDRFVDPFVSGVYAGDPEALAMGALFPSVVEAEQRAGSVVRGLLFGKRREKARETGRGKGRGQGRQKGRGQPRPRRKILWFDGGLSAWPGAVAARLGVLGAEASDPMTPGVRLSSPVTSIAPAPCGGWTVRWGQHELTTSGVVLAVPAPAAARLLPRGFEDGIQALGEIPHAPVDVVHLVWPRGALRHPMDGFGLLAPSGEGRAILGSLWPSSLFPRAFREVSVLANFLGGARRAHPTPDPETLLESAEREIRDLLGGGTAPLLRSVRQWSLGIPQYVAGHRGRMAALADVEGRAPGLALAGSYRGGVSLGDCWANGKKAAERVARQGGVQGREGIPQIGG
jgi:protoporphyrinogen/coproporphyrinogen III oxidase